MTLSLLAWLGFVIGLLICVNPAIVGIFTMYIASIRGQFGISYKTALLSNLFVVCYLALISLFTYGFYSLLKANQTDYIHAFTVIAVIAANGIGIYMLRTYFVSKKEYITIKPLKRLAKKALVNTSVVKSLALSSWYAFVATLPTIGVGVMLLSTISIYSELDFLIWFLPFSLSLIGVMYYLMFHTTTANGLAGVVHWQKKYQSTMALYTGIALIFLSWITLYSFLVGPAI
jgi:hypothetical protein